MTVIKEIDCPECGAKGSIEAFERDGKTIGDCVCEECGCTIPEGISLKNYLAEK
ncbi:MAG TPA: hypothetical protein IAA44_06330 [Candidatus Blautia avistercoris]|nr:hypothetical protein [Candidatus Blautia avistercoris]